ncbi:MAG: hypothetical protein U1E02_28100 [Hydrogenophaga sp.]|uniref:hypothetical protein n=1 Tax=Hydrogenophaga sp. TaxID=1904254 RepID=UPI0027301E22|nr:hypothetical protein [Hydrogenophaga sp.]MDP2249808.1 hypothetical protein [Hydrogenophaga sp.]MDZ4127998.1 hypothetical protein [Hydrogenophaga sp.]
MTASPDFVIAFLASFGAGLERGFATAKATQSDIDSYQAAGDVLLGSAFLWLGLFAALYAYSHQKLNGESCTGAVAGGLLGYFVGHLVGRLLLRLDKA